ncbi:hypothetical protein DBR47_14220 [Paucibacter sp. KBW04]|uniref:HAF repeat-containing PEP-CTERM protein n=1 Tax=Paucibacter sp. KBW04 TaxID=2153361 RepID=UPI000F560371|nr:HAF repeat-containing PEP-CTERM protein [Paucibacter sp. KBW04]RQO57947.1 hypothetical protein DBR47_14220 [Paucibacter sp. KBW04]
MPHALRKTVLFAAILQFLPVAAQAGEIRWQAQAIPNLPSLGDSQALTVTAINDAGQVVGGAKTADGLYHAFLYSGGQMLSVGGPVAAGYGSIATGISNPQGPLGRVNVVGTVTGSNNLGALGFTQSFRGNTGQLGTAQQFAIPNGTDLQVSGVNQSGQLVGSVADSAGTQPQAFLRGADGQLAMLPSPVSRHVAATAINDAGQIAGYYYRSSDSSYRAALWDGGQFRDLGSLGGNSAYAAALNGQGTAVGQSLIADGQNLWHAFKWRDGAMTRIAGVLDQGFASGASGINEGGQTVGWFTQGNHRGNQAFLHSDSGGAVDLGAYTVGLQAGERPAGAVGINALGQIVAQSSSGRALLLSPEGSLSWAQSAGGSISEAGNWDSGLGFTPNRLLDVEIVSSSAQTVFVDRSFSAKSLQLGGDLPGGNAAISLRLNVGHVIDAGSGLVIGRSGTLSGDGRVLGQAGVLNHGAVMARFDGVLALDGGLDNRGLITGNGRIEANVINRGGGATGIQVGAGQHLTLAGTAHSMADASHVRIQDGGTLAFEGRLINQGGATVEIQRGVLQVDYGANAMQNGGHILVGSGRAEILGNVYNNARGLIHAQDGADLTIWDGLVNDGEVRVSGGARIVYAGAVSGKGSFTGLEGMHRFEGGYSPGASPAEVQMGNVQFASLVTMELGGLSPGSQHDRIVFSSSVLFEETSFLQINLVNGFTPHAGDHFALFSYAQAPVGSFEDFYLPSLTAGLSWDVSQLHSTGVLWVSGVPEPQTWTLMGLGLACLFRLRPGRQFN